MALTNAAPRLPTGTVAPEVLEETSGARETDEDCTKEDVGQPDSEASPPPFSDLVVLEECSGSGLHFRQRKLLSDRLSFLTHLVCVGFPQELHNECKGGSLLN